MKLKVKAPFKWAHQGVRVEEFAAGQVIETEDADLIEVSQHEGWTVRPRTRTQANGTEAAEGAETAEGSEGADSSDGPEGAEPDDAATTAATAATA